MMGLVIALIAVAVKVMVKLVAVAMKLVSILLGLVAHFFPLVLLIGGICWLIYGMDRGSAPTAKTCSGDATPPPLPPNLD